MLADHAAAIAELDRKDRRSREMRALNAQIGSTLTELCGIAERMAAELLVEVGDPRRFAGEGGFARFNGTAPIPVSSGEGDGEPNATDSTVAATDASMSCSTGWPSPSYAATNAPAPSTTTPAEADTPNAKPCASSNDNSATSSTATCSATSPTEPAENATPLDIGASVTLVKADFAWSRAASSNVEPRDSLPRGTSARQRHRDASVLEIFRDCYRAREGSALAIRSTGRSSFTRS